MDKQELPLESGCRAHHDPCEALSPKKKVSFDHLLWED